MAKRKNLPGFSIGDLARHAGCRVETIRYYEGEGLMPAPPRTEGGHRVYGGADMKRLTFIRRARELGFELDQVRGLLALADSDDFCCADVKAVTLEHLQAVRRRVSALNRLDVALSDLAAQCPGGNGKDCAILDALFDGDSLSPGGPAGPSAPTSR